MKPSSLRRERELSAWLDGELDAPRAREVEARLEGDAAARAEVEAWRQIAAALRAERRVERGPDVADEVMAEVHAIDAARARRRAFASDARAIGLAAMAAALVVVAHRSGGWRADERAADLPSEAQVARQAQPTADTTVEVVDFGGRGGTIYLAAGAPVVWLDDDESRGAP